MFDTPEKPKRKQKFKGIPPQQQVPLGIIVLLVGIIIALVVMRRPAPVVVPIAISPTLDMPTLVITQNAATQCAITWVIGIDDALSPAWAAQLDAAGIAYHEAVVEGWHEDAACGAGKFYTQPNVDQIVYTAVVVLDESSTTWDAAARGAYIQTVLRVLPDFELPRPRNVRIVFGLVRWELPYADALAAVDRPPAAIWEMGYQNP